MVLSVPMRSQEFAAMVFISLATRAGLLQPGRCSAITRPPER